MDKTCFAAQVAEVEVDPETGEVKLLNFTTVDDVARVINPIGHQGQINGGLVQGLGYAFREELRGEEGRGRTVARIEAATLAGVGIGIVAAGPRWEAFARFSFLLNAGLYDVSFAI